MENQTQKNSNNNSLEGVELLGLSSSDSLDSPSFAHFEAPKTKRKVRFKKTFRSSLRSKPGSKSVSRTCNCNILEGAKLLGSLLLLAIVGGLLWYVVILSTRIQELQTKFSDIEAGNRNTPEALHMIHSKLKLLDSNVTMLFIEVRKNIVDIDNITSEIKLMKDVAKNIKDSIASAPTIQQLPSQVHSLSADVANFGSKVNTFETNVKEFKEQQSSLATLAQNHSKELNSMKLAVQEIINSTDLQSKSANSSFNELKFQSAIQETNQTLQRVQEQLKLYKDMPSKMDMIDRAVMVLVNNTQTQNAHILGLEDFTVSNLTLRLEQMELEREFPVAKEKAQDLEKIVNRTLASALLQTINRDVIHLDNQSEARSDLRVLEQTHDVLQLLAALLRQFESIPKSDILSDKNASEVVAALMQNSLSDLLVTRDAKIKMMESELKNVSQKVQQISEVSQPVMTEPDKTSASTVQAPTNNVTSSVIGP